MTANAPPPSSRRLRTSPDLSVTTESPMMRQLCERAAEVSSRGYVLLVIPQEESLELRSFAERIAERRDARGAVIIVNQNDPNILKSGEAVLNDRRALLFPNASRIHERVIAQFIRHHGERAVKMAIAAFPSSGALKEAVDQWPAEMRRCFHPEVLIWPALKQRPEDLTLIARRICGQMMSRDKRITASLSPKALDEVIKDPRDVRTLYESIRDGFEVMLRAGHHRITPEHLRLSRDAIKRREFFSTDRAERREERLPLSDAIADLASDPSV